MDKEQILNNVDNLTAKQLFDYICNGAHITLEDLKKTGLLDASKRKAIQSLIDKAYKEDDDAWHSIEFSTKEMDFRNYITNFPAGRHVGSAKSEIQKLRDDVKSKLDAKQHILNQLRNKSGGFTPSEINEYLINETLSQDDLLSHGIPEEIINQLGNVKDPQLNLGQPPTSIPDGYTEVYFWGIPGSGKTCALGAILNTAEREGLLEIATGPGYNYMTQLKNIFAEEYSTLPAPSPTDITQYLPFVLRKEKQKPRSVSLIELSGEIFECFYHHNAKLPFPSQTHQDTFDTLLDFLEGSNRKIHFFFVDYEKENTLNNAGYTQGDYLSAAATFFKDNDVFGKSTDAIYIVLTKSDLMDCAESERDAGAVKYLKENHFSAFINSLKARCQQHSINGGKLTVEPFSLGEVFLKKFCKIDRTSSLKIIDILYNRIRSNSKSVLDIFNQ